LLSKTLAAAVLYIYGVSVNANVIIGAKFCKDSNDVSFFMVVWSYFYFIFYFFIQLIIKTLRAVAHGSQKLHIIYCFTGESLLKLLNAVAVVLRVVICMS